MAPKLLKGAPGVSEFVAADVIARGISGYEPERAAFADNSGPGGASARRRRPR